jgi:hypothetical protein
MVQTMTMTKRLFSSLAERRSPRDLRAIGLAGMALGIFTLVLAVDSFHQNQLFDGPTTKVIGSVEALYPSSAQFPRRNNPNVAYCYPVGTTEVHSSAGVSEGVFDGLHVGDPLPVKFLPDNPTMNRIDVEAENGERQETPYFLTASSILFLCLGAFVFRSACHVIKWG